MNKKDLLMDIFLIVLGNMILALGVSVFILPTNLLTGGVAGISVALEPLFSIPPSITINVLTIGLFLIGALFLGKKFTWNTILSTILYPLFITLFSSLVEEQITQEPILCSIYAGICTGTGIALVFRTGASTGGMDIPPLIINKFTGIPIPTLVMVIDGITVCLGVLAYGVEAALVGLISVFVSSYVINKVLTFGGHNAKNVMIISKKKDEIISAIYTELNRGATILQATGGYTGEKRPMLMVVISHKQYPVLSKAINKIDPEAFVVVTDTTEVQGEGFTYEEEM